jgi:phosphate transport system substrate-binding protein
MILRSIIGCALLLLNGCAFRLGTAQNSPTEIRIKGSDSMLLLVQRLAEQYMQRHPGSSIAVEGGGSGAGIAALIDGTVELCASSRPLAPNEVTQLAARYRSIGVSILCAKDALTIITHPSNPVSSLTMQQLTGIFTGAITHWSQVGGNDLPVTVYGRESNSGTFLYFEDHVLLGADYTRNVRVVPGARALVQAVANDSSAIGYSTSVYAERVHSVAVEGVAPTAEHVRNGTYPVTRYLYFYSVHQPAGEVKRFLDWVVSAEGQRVATANGYTPLYNIE